MRRLSTARSPTWPRRVTSRAMGSGSSTQLHASWFWSAHDPLRRLTVGRFQLGAIEEIASLGPEDVLVSASCSPYSRAVVDVAKAAREKDLIQIAITDRASSPLVSTSSVALFAAHETSFLLNSLTAYMALAECLINGCATALGQDAAESLADSERLIGWMSWSDRPSEPHRARAAAGVGTRTAGDRLRARGSDRPASLLLGTTEFRAFREQFASLASNRPRVARCGRCRFHPRYRFPLGSFRNSGWLQQRSRTTEDAPRGRGSGRSG